LPGKKDLWGTVPWIEIEGKRISRRYGSCKEGKRRKWESFLKNTIK